MVYVIEPHVAGELGDGTCLDPSTHPPRVSSVEYVLDTPRAADLIESFPVYLVSHELARELVDAKLSGFSLDEARVVPSLEYLAAYGDTPHKQYRRLRLIPSAEADCWLDERHLLHVSDRMMEVLQRFDLTYADIERVER